MSRVLHVIDTTGPGGAETVFVELADRIRKRGYESVALLRGPGWVMSALQARAVPTHLLDAKGSFNGRFLRNLRALILRERIDLIQTHLLGSSVYGGMAGWLTRKPTVATFHGAVDFAGDGRSSTLKRWVMNRTVRAYVAVSEDLATKARRAGIYKTQETTVIYNGIDLYRYGAGRVRRRLIDELGLPQDAILVGSLGNIRPAKSYDVLLRAAADICKQHERVHFVVAGAFDDRGIRPLRALLADLSLTHRVHFLGFRNDTAEYLRDLDVFVLSSSSEGFSIATIEAQAAGLPVIATRCGGPEEIITDRKTGLLVPSGDAPALAAAIRAVLEDAVLAAAIATAGQASAKARFSIEEMINRYAAMYGRLLGI